MKSKEHFNGLVEASDVYEFLEAIERKHNESHELVKDLHTNMGKDVKAIALNTAAMAKGFSDLRSDNVSLVKVVANKKEIPPSIFLLVVAGLLVAYLLTVVYLTRTNLNLTPSSLNMSHHDTNESISQNKAPDAANPR